MNGSKGSALPPVLSVYLDLVRFGAAVVVVLSHAWPVLVPGHDLPWPGHQAVVVFFVLSWLVIAHASTRPGLSAGEYAIHRAARIWSVAIPALLLSLIAAAAVGTAGQLEAPSVEGQFGAIPNLVLNAVFAGQLWFADVQPPFDSAYWSLNYEVWYYALFGAWFFLRGRPRVLTIVVIAAVAGPKILLLLPIWVLGVVLYRHQPALSERVALLIFLASAGLALLFVGLGAGIEVRHALWPYGSGVLRLLGGSNEFLTDWLFGLIVAANFAAAAQLGRYGDILLRFTSPIRAAAGHTFSAYLYHQPLLAFIVLVAGWRHWTGLLLLALGVAILAQCTEKQLPAVRRFLHAAASRFGVIAPASPLKRASG
jgi:peptidoglycan/LPS O-acetylase OafA/YrhL